MAHDASPSWSGFNYQGKVAIFYALKFINTSFKANPDYDFTGHRLILERNEDFEIEVNTVVKTVHQVKAYQHSSFSKYKNALIGLALGLQLRPGALGYLHTWYPLNPKDKKTLQESIADELEILITEYKIAPIPENTIIGRAAKGGDNLPKTAAIIREALAGLNGTEIIGVLNRIKDDLDTALSRIKCYEYPDGNAFCSLSAIDAKVKAELLQAFKDRALPSPEEHVGNAFDCFLGYIDNHIRERHENIKNPTTIPIEFSDILGILKKDFQDPSSDYLAYQFKSLLLQTFDEFEADDTLYVQPDVDDGAHCNLREVRLTLCKLPPKQLLSIYEAAAPHLTLDSENNTTNALKIDLQGIKIALLPIFQLIDTRIAERHITPRRMTYRRSANPTAHYLPTSINPGLSSANVARNIIQNPKMVEILFEIKTIINNAGIDGTILKLARDRHALPDLNNKVQRERRDDIIQTTRFISATKAKEELDAD